MRRYDYINKLVKERGYKSYLEIGIDKGGCFRKVQCAKKTGVDPVSNVNGIIKKNSDDFFGSTDEKFDIIFIDGLHTAEQVESDIVNGMAHLNKGGVLVLHDINPPTEESQEVPKISSPWKGTVWRAMVGFIKKYPEVEAYTLANTDTGLGVIEYVDMKIKEGFSTTIKYATFDKSRKKYLNIIG